MTKLNDTKQTVISEKSLIPISFAVLLLGGALRVESISSKADFIYRDAQINAREIENLQREDKELRAALTNAIIESNTRLSNIEGAMGIKKQ